MNYIGLDVGNKTIGIAVSYGIIAQGLSTYFRKTLQLDVEHIEKIVKDYEAFKIIVGLPKNMNGSIGFQGEKVIQFAEELKKIVGVEVEFIDERLTTVLANNFMLEADLSRKKRKSIVDKMAAQIILQDYLDRLNNK